MAVGVGYLLAGLPNVELMTLVVALSGLTLGSRLGAVCGAVSVVVYSLGSPLGLPVPLLLAGQMAGMGLAGVWGSVLGRAVLRAGRRDRKIHRILLAAATGLTATLGYDLLTNLAIMGMLDLAPLVVLTGAVPFVLLHLAFNTAVFVMLFPLLGERLQGLAAAPLRGSSRTALLLGLGLLLTAGTTAAAQPDHSHPPAETPESTRPAPVDSVAAIEADPRPVSRTGWRRPLWEPHAPTLVQWLTWRSSRVTLQDGGLGAAALVLGEAGTGGHAAVERDGVPLGTGHALVDDIWLVSNQGVAVVDAGQGPDPASGQDNLLVLATEDQHPDQAYSLYRGTKGAHETYHRGLSLLTPRAAWRVGFSFHESLDNEGYNFTEDPDPIFRTEVDFPGHFKVRISRTSLERALDPDSSLRLEYTTGRYTKDLLPAWNAEHREIWATGAAATMKSRVGRWQARTIFHWSSRDMRWGERPNSAGPAEDSRLLEVVREGVKLDLGLMPAAPDSAAEIFPGTAGPAQDGPTTTGLSLRLANWEVADTGVDWWPGRGGPLAGRGQDAHFVARSGLRWSGLLLTGGATAGWDSHGGLTPGGFLELGSGPGPDRWQLSLSRFGRAPRSDELLTPLERDVAGRRLHILPEADLEREKAWRLAAEASMRLLGFDFAVDGSLRRLQDGITWVADSSDDDTGRWANALKMNSSRVTGSVGRQGRLLGWVRARLEGTWQTFDEVEGQAALLPPEQFFRLELMWENHFFREDGILQIALFSTRRGEMADPWDPTRGLRLPEVTFHDLVVGFRLVGADLSLAIRNLTDQQVRLSAGALSQGREMEMRLRWGFYY